MEAKPLNKVSSSSPSAAWTGLTPARTSTNSEMQQPAHILSSEDRQRTTVFCSCFMRVALSFTTCSIIHVHRWVTRSRDGKSTMATGQIDAEFKPWLFLQVDQQVKERSWCVTVACRQRRCFPTLMLQSWTWDCTRRCLCQVWFCLHLSVFTKWCSSTLCTFFCVAQHYHLP